MQAKSSNHDRAPLCAAFVKAMRETFGEISVLYVSENGLQLGEKDANQWASCFFVGKAEE
jgi:hypothetical protein